MIASLPRNERKAVHIATFVRLVDYLSFRSKHFRRRVSAFIRVVVCHTSGYHSDVFLEEVQAEIHDVHFIRIFAVLPSAHPSYQYIFWMEMSMIHGLLQVRAVAHYSRQLLDELKLHAWQESVLRYH